MNEQLGRGILVHSYKESKIVERDDSLTLFEAIGIVQRGGFDVIPAETYSRMIQELAAYHMADARKVPSFPR